MAVLAGEREDEPIPNSNDSKRVIFIKCSSDLADKPFSSNCASAIW
jgi:hypothetical protein